jgi:hypothetical protein
VTSQTPKIQRDLLARLTQDDRLIRYLEGLAQEIDDRAPLTGLGSPLGLTANLSRLYIDLDDGNLWINANAQERQSTGWLNKG